MTGLYAAGYPTTCWCYHLQIAKKAAPHLNAAAEREQGKQQGKVAAAAAAAARFAQLVVECALYPLGLRLACLSRVIGIED
jgi:hypothetical protein